MFSHLAGSNAYERKKKDWHREYRDRDKEKAACSSSLMDLVVLQGEERTKRGAK